MKINWLFFVGVFLLLAFSFLFDLWGEQEGRNDLVIVNEKFISKEAIAEPMLEARTKLTKMECNQCHANIVPGVQAKTAEPNHPDIILQHGTNTCTTCHNRSHREVLVGPNNEALEFSRSEMLCSRCHADKFRDWNIGAHGRVSGYWDKSRGEQTKLTCVACHNPHSPKFKATEPAPRPHHIHELRAFLKSIEGKSSQH